MIVLRMSAGVFNSMMELLLSLFLISAMVVVLYNGVYVHAERGW